MKGVWRTTELFSSKLKESKKSRKEWEKKEEKERLPGRGAKGGREKGGRGEGRGVEGEKELGEREGEEKWFVPPLILIHWAEKEDEKIPRDVGDVIRSYFVPLILIPTTFQFPELPNC